MKYRLAVPSATVVPLFIYLPDARSARLLWEVTAELARRVPRAAFPILDQRESESDPWTTIYTPAAGLIIDVRAEPTPGAPFRVTLEDPQITTHVYLDDQTSGRRAWNLFNNYARVMGATGGAFLEERNPISLDYDRIVDPQALSDPEAKALL